MGRGEGWCERVLEEGAAPGPPVARRLQLHVPSSGRSAPPASTEQGACQEPVTSPTRSYERHTDRLALFNLRTLYLLLFKRNADDR